MFISKLYSPAFAPGIIPSDDNMFLLTSGGERFNTMTASWGGIMKIWNSDCVCVFVRPQRYTCSFMEDNSLFTLCYFDPLYRPVFTFCGTHSGKDCDKAEQTGLIPVTEDGYTYFLQAEKAVVCRKIFAGDLDPEGLTEARMRERFYPADDRHRMYIGQIEKVLFKA